MRIISGMHRSGTSLMGRLFFLAGADMGNPETFRPPNRWNPFGYFEQSDVNALNKKLLHGPYGKLVYLWLPSTNTLIRRSRQNVDQVQAVAQKYQDRVIKGPRFCLTLPAWLAVGAEVERLIICLREPIQVAQSIQRRNHVLICYGLHLWYLHNQRLLDHLQDIPVWFVRFSHLINENTRTTELAHALQFFEYPLTADQVHRLAEEHIKPEQRNHTRTTYPYSRPVQQLWDDLCARHAAQFE